MARDPWDGLRPTMQFLRGTAWVAGAAVKTGVFLHQLSQSKQQRPPDLVAERDPMAGMANAQELSRFAYDPDGFYLGKIHEDHGEDFDASISGDDDRHILVCAGSATGKGLTLGVQCGIRWKGPLFAIDPKGEMAEITGMRRASRDDAKGSGTSVRQFLGQKVAILDPMHQVRGPAKKFRVNYDPMTDIPDDQRTARKRIRKLAAGMIVPESGNNAHFSDNCQTLVAGVIEAVKILEPARNHCLPFVRKQILGNVKVKDERKLSKKEESEVEAGFFKLVKYLSDDRLPEDGHAAEAASVLSDVLGSDEAGSFRTTMSRNLKWMIDMDMQDHLKPSRFSLWKAVQQGWTIYVVMDPDEIQDFRNWLRMTVQIALSAKMALGTNQPGPQTLMLLDEFAVLGRFSEIEAKAGYIRGYSVKLAYVIQGIGQLQQLYEKNWEAFVDNAAAMIAWGVNGKLSEDYIADRIGKVVVEETSYGENTGQSMSGINPNSSTGASSTTAVRERMIRFPNEVRAQGARETMRAFVIPASGAAFTIRRVPYNELAEHKVFDSNEHIARWERGVS